MAMVGPGSLVSVLPWQISDVPVVEEPLQYYLLTYYFDNVNMAVKALGQAGRTPLRLMEDMAAAPVVQCTPRETEELRQLLERLRQEELTFALPSLRYRYAPRPRPPHGGTGSGTAAPTGTAPSPGARSFPAWRTPPAWR